MRNLNINSFLSEVKLFRKNNNSDKILNMREIHLINDSYSENENIIDLKNIDFTYIDFSWSDFQNIDFSYSNFSHSIFNNASFKNTNFSFANLTDVSFFAADLRSTNLSFSNCDATIFTSSLLMGANLEGLNATERTVHFRISCPETGYFFGYKKCFNDRMVKLLIPADAKRSSSTSNACRCDKAITVAIMNKDKTGFYTEANSFVDENFIYRLGEMSYADSYNEDRWLDSSNGIHFWMSFDEALKYM